MQIEIQEWKGQKPGNRENQRTKQTWSTYLLCFTLTLFHDLYYFLKKSIAIGRGLYLRTCTFTWGTTQEMYLYFMRFTFCSQGHVPMQFPHDAVISSHSSNSQIPAASYIKLKDFWKNYHTSFGAFWCTFDTLFHFLQFTDFPKINQS